MTEGRETGASRVHRGNGEKEGRLKKGLLTGRMSAGLPVTLPAKNILARINVSRRERTLPESRLVGLQNEIIFAPSRERFFTFRFNYRLLGKPLFATETCKILETKAEVV